jgi:imidazolonepropionase-like amidohydrolase
MRKLHAIIVSIVLTAPGTGFAGITVIRAERAFTGQEIVENVCIVVKDDLISDIIPMKDFTPIEGSVIIDAAGTTVLPGFIDSHVHILSMPIQYLSNIPRYGWGRLAEEMKSQVPRNRRELLESGITTVIDMGAPVDSVARMARDLAADRILGPDLYFGGPLFTAPGGHPAGTIYRGRHTLIDTATAQVSEQGPALEKVAELQSKGASFIKLVYDDGAFYGGKVPRLDLALAGAITDAAHARRLRVIAHVGAVESCFADMIGIGVDGIEHCFAYDGSDAVFQEMASRGVSFTPTLSIYELYAPEAMRRMQESVRRAFAQGVPITAGTDFPSTRFMNASEGYFRELALLEEAGVPRLDVLRAATVNAARKLGEEGEVGSLAPGRTANIVMVDGDIMEGALAPERVRTVMLHGKVVFQDRKLIEGLQKGFRRSSFVISPYGFFDPVAGFSVGLNVMDFNLINTGIAVSLNAAYSFSNHFGAEIAISPPSPIPSTSLGATFHFDNYPRRFFGLSNDSVL